MLRFSLLTLLLSIVVAKSTLAQNNTHQSISRVIDLINARNAAGLLSMMTPEATVGGIQGLNNTASLSAILKNFNKTTGFSIAFDSLQRGGGRKIGLITRYDGRSPGKPTFTFNHSGKIVDLGIIRARKKVDTGLALAEVLRKSSRPDSITLNVKLVNGLMYVPARLNNRDGYFLFDSGCPVVILNRKFCNSEREVKGVSFDFEGMGGKMNELVWTEANTLNWAGTEVSDLGAPAAYMDDVNIGDGLAYFGLLGYGMFNDYQITFDYQQSRLLMERVDDAGHLLSGPFNKGRLAGQANISMRRHIPVVSIAVNNKVYEMGIDCGANANVIRSSLKKEIGSSFDYEQEAVSINGVGASDETASSGFLMGAMLSEIPLQDMYSVFTNQAIGAGVGPQSLGVQGLLGTPFLNQYRTTLNFRTGKIMFYR